MVSPDSEQYTGPLDKVFSPLETADSFYAAFNGAIQEEGSILKIPSLQVLVIGTTDITETMYVWNTQRSYHDAITFIDHRFPVLRPAHAALRFEQQQIHVLQADQATLPFSPGLFDVIISHGLLDTLHDAEAVRILHEAVRVMHPGGIQLHTTVYQITLLARSFKENVLGEDSTQTGTNAYYRTQEATLALFKNAGMNILATAQELMQQAATYAVTVD